MENKLFAMTDNQKYIIEQLFTGSFITVQMQRYRLLDKARNPQRVFNTKTYKGIQKLLRISNGVLVIDLRKVRSLSGHTWVKKYYKSLNKK